MRLDSQLIEAWGFVTGFCDLLGVPGFSLESLLSALLQGSSSPLLGLLHIVLRQSQADMEEAHATGVLQVGDVGLLQHADDHGAPEACCLSALVLMSCQCTMLSMHCLPWLAGAIPHHCSGLLRL